MGFLRRQREPDPIAERLDSLGFFRLADDPRGVKAEFARKGADAFWSADHGRLHLFADAEDLAEGGVGEAVKELAPTFLGLGVLFDEDIEEEIDERRYVVRVEGREYVIYDDPGPVEMWALAWARTFRILNDILEADGSDMRAYAAYENHLWLLTPEEFEVVTEALGESRSRPYVPTEEPPRYGEPLGPD
jgi:hypothetical protein